jgi:HEAT repeat protein
MRHLLEPAVLALLGIAVFMLFAILAGRALRDRRRGRERALRPLLQQAIAAYLVDEQAEVPQLPVSRTALRVLRAIGVEGLTELRGGERERLTDLLEQMGIVSATAAELRSRRRWTRRMAAQALAQIESPEAAGALVEGLSDRDLDVRVTCALALAELGDPRYDQALARTISEVAERRPGAVTEMLLALGANNPPMLGLVLEATDSLRIRRLVTAVAGALRLSEYAPIIRRELESPEAELASTAAEAAGLIGDLEAYEGLLALARDESRPEFVRASAATALGRLGDERAAPALEELLLSGGWDLQTAAAQALGILGPSGEDVLRRTRSFHAPVALGR